MQRRSLLAMAALALTTSASAQAMYAYVPLTVRLAEADLVVQGTIRKETGVIQRNGQPFVVAELEVSKVLKGPKDVKVTSLAWSQPPQPQGGGLILVSDGPVRYRVGQTGLWILRFDPAQCVHLAEYPTDRQQDDQAKAVQDKLAEIDKFPWSEPVQGLQMALYVEQQDMRNAKPFINGKPVKAIAQGSVYVLLRNASKSAMHVNQFYGDEPIQIDLRGPDGKSIPLTLYGQRPANAPVPQPREQDFVALGPDQVRSFSYGFGLGLLQKAGPHSVTVTYKSDRDAKGLGVEDAWRGSLASPKTTFTTPPAK